MKINARKLDESGKEEPIKVQADYIEVVKEGAAIVAHLCEEGGLREINTVDVISFED